MFAVTVAICLTIFACFVVWSIATERRVRHEATHAKTLALAERLTAVINAQEAMRLDLVRVENAIGSRR